MVIVAARERARPSSRPLRNWLLTSPLDPDAAARQARSASTMTGGQPLSEFAVASTPELARASSRSWMGRSRMRAMPSRR